MIEYYVWLTRPYASSNPFVADCRRAGAGAVRAVQPGGDTARVSSSAADDPSVSQLVFTITEKAPTRASWLKAATTAFTFKTLLRHYAKWTLTPRSLNVKLGLRRKGHKGHASK